MTQAGRIGIAVVAALVCAAPSAAQVSPEQTVINATNVLAQTAGMQSGIPQNLLAEAQGIVIVPNMIRGAFVIGVQHGRGVLLVRGPDGSWQPPQMVQITGGSLGYQIGVQSTDLILVFRTPQSVANLLRGTLKIGVDASAAAGPVGRQASAATDLPLQAEILSYSRARGAFLGVSIDGSSISLDPAAQAAYYLPGQPVPPSAAQLIQVLTAYSSGGPAVVPPVQPTVATGPPVVPQAPGNVEAARQQLDAASRQLAAQLDNQWRQYLALPPEVYLPNQSPNLQALEQTIARYEAVAGQPQYATLAARLEFQQTLQGLWRLAELQQGTQQLRLPPPPMAGR